MALVEAEEIQNVNSDIEESIQPYAIPPALSELYVERLKEQTRYDLSNLRNSLPKRQNPELVRLLGFTKAVISSLVDDHIATLDFQTIELIFSVCTLIYSSALDELIPELTRSRMREEANQLINALFSHSRNRHYTASYRHWLRYQLFQNIGQDDLAIEELEQSVKLSSFHDHDHISRLQALWIELVERQEYVMATEILLEQYRHCPLGLVEELDHMILRIVESASNHNRPIAYR